MPANRWVVEQMNVATDLEAVREVDRDAFPGRGTAEMFLREVEQRNISYVFVVRAANTAARRLYEQAGFRVAGLRERYYSGPVDDALVLWRESLGLLETVPAV